MGEVWLVRHKELGVERVVKVVVSTIAHDAEILRRLKLEARLLAKLMGEFSHPHAVAVHDARITDQAAFIEMDYVRGLTLLERLAPGVPMPLDWTARILVQLCDILQVAHSLGIVHRDLKPANLMLLDGRPPGQEFLKVLHFGIAKILGARDVEEEDSLVTRPGIFLGTAAYASPDVFLRGSVDARSDIYSVGVILYEFLTGYRPFAGSLEALLYAHQSTPPPPFAQRNPQAQVPPEVERVVLRCLAKDADARPPSARALAEEFLRALPATVIAPGPLPPPSTQAEP